MSYSTSLPGLDEATRTALKTLIVNSLTDLNASLARDALTPMTWTSGQVVLGDPLRLSASRISIIGGNESDGMDMSIRQVMSPVVYESVITTNIYVYIWPDEFPGSDYEAQEAMRELSLSRVCDHLRVRLLNDASNASITLTSREYAISPAYDALQMCKVTKVLKTWAVKDFGKQTEVRCAHLIHEGTIA